MVRSKQAEAAAVDANALAHVNRKLLEKDTGEIKVLTSIGPLPPYPILVNATLPGLKSLNQRSNSMLKFIKMSIEPLRQQIASSLLAMSSRSGWADRLMGFGVEKFVTNGPAAYDAYTNLKSEVKGMSLNQVYYY
jgi:ABC-type phosphate/phosphonate transport system substrate-binding protein